MAEYKNRREKMTEEERARRRAAKRRREALRRKRQLRRRIMAGTGSFGAVILVLLILSLHSCRQEETDVTVNVGEETASGDVAVTETSTPSPTVAPSRITISAAGDCTLGTDEDFDYDTSFAAMYESVDDPGYFFENVRSIFEEDDLTIVNLEGPLTTSEDIQEKTFNFKGDPSWTSILTAGSVEAVNLANNHSYDYGEQGYQDTIANVEDAGITSFGYERTAIMTVNGIKVGLTGIYELAEEMGCEDDLRENIQTLKEEGAQLIIVSFHWGVEREYYPDENQQALAHIAIDEGADLVLGHHPHVLQGIETYQGKKIVYSLGNFCFGGNKNPEDKDTMIFTQSFTVNGDGTVEADDPTIIPCSISSSSDYNDYQPTPAEGSESERILNRIETYSEGFE